MQRFYYFLVTVMLLGTEVLIALFVHDRFIRPYIGDVLVVILLYTFIRIFLPNGMHFLPLWIFIFAIGVEVLQYFRIVEFLHLQDNAFFRILLGSVFDFKDIACYGVGCGILGIYEFCTNKRKNRQ